MNEATKTKAMAGIRKFLDMRGFEIVEDGWKSGKNSVNFIARDEDDLVFVNCNSRRSCRMRPGPISGD